MIHTATECPVMRKWRIVDTRMGNLKSVLTEPILNRTADDVARLIGLASAKALSRELRRRQLPPYRPLRNWCLVVALVDQCAQNLSLCRLSLQSMKDPAAYYRAVRVTTGHTWTQVQALGPLWCRDQALQAWSLFTCIV